MTRIVGYGYSVPTPDGFLAPSIFDEPAMERLLSSARERGVVTEYDTGRGALVWFNGRPGAELRRVRAAVLALLPAGAVPMVRGA